MARVQAEATATDHTIPVGSLELGFLELGFSLRNKYKQQTKETLNVESGVLVAKCL